MYRAHIAIDEHLSTKREQTCVDHVRSVAALTKSHLQPLGLPHIGELAGLLHDMGKFTEEFDAYIESASRGDPVRRGSVIHSFAGVSYLLNRYHISTNAEMSNIAAQVLSTAIGSHHGFFDLWNDLHQSGFQHRLLHQPEYDKRAARNYCANCLGEECLAQIYRDCQDEMNRFLTDRIHYATSHEELYFALGALVRLVTSALVDGDRTDTRCFMNNQSIPSSGTPDWNSAADHLKQFLAHFPQDTPVEKARREFSDLCANAASSPSGLFRLDLPTGGGKTLSALRFAVLHARTHRMRRVIYVAPLLSIIEQNVQSIRTALGATIQVLQHHSNLIREELSPDEAANIELLQETWDSPVIVTTLVQFLETLFSGRMSAVRRFHSLSESVIILDEVQSVPRKMLSLFNSALNFLTKCCGATIVLCSATQPPFDDQHIRHKLLPCKRIIDEETFRRYTPLFRRTHIKNAGNASLDDIAKEAKEIASAERRLLIVCNTKREASDLFQMLADTPEVQLFHLSAGMCMHHRKQTLEKLRRVLDTHRKVICVATQVIEAGIDISFDTVIRLSAGLDSIVQAAGRCNRHGEHSTPQPVLIYHLQGEKLGALRQIRQAQTALSVLLEEYRLNPEHYGNDLTSDAAVKDYYLALYKGMAQGEQDYPTSKGSLLELLTHNKQFVGNDPDAKPYWLRQAFHTAGELFSVFDSHMEGILVPYEEGAVIIQQLARRGADMAALLEKAKPYVVSVPQNQIVGMISKGMVSTLLDGKLYVLNPAYYDPNVGIKEELSCNTLIL